MIPTNQSGQPPDSLEIEPEVISLRRALHERDAMLKHLLDTLETQKHQVARNFINAMEKMVLPSLAALRTQLNPNEQKQLDSAMTSLKDLMSPFLERLDRDLAALTPAQARISNLIRQGLSCKEIAALEHISVTTVGTHRRNIRRKLGLTHSKANLSTFLNQRIGQTLTAHAESAHQPAMRLSE